MHRITIQKQIKPLKFECSGGYKFYHLYKISRFYNVAFTLFVPFKVPQHQAMLYPLSVINSHLSNLNHRTRQHSQHSKHSQHSEHSEREHGEMWSLRWFSHFLGRYVLLNSRKLKFGILFAIFL